MESYPQYVFFSIHLLVTYAFFIFYQMNELIYRSTFIEDLGCESIIRNVLQGLKVNIKKYEYMKMFVAFDCLLIFLKGNVVTQWLDKKDVRAWNIHLQLNDINYLTLYEVHKLPNK